ncbi:MAG: hypothetical protein RBU37_13380 [Myxococcota bacterium]|jgi:hypothetical protein|nr:hypothetical protein [Myxococcota bacterium]
MSQVYTIRLAESVSKRVSAQDEQRHRVELTPILSAEQTRELVIASLRADGWTEVEPGVFEKQQGAERWRWNVDQSEVVASIELERELSSEVNAVGRGESKAEATRQAERDIALRKGRVAVELEAARRNMQAQVSEQLEQGEEERKRQLNRVIQQVHADALKRKAQSLGTVLSIDERESGDEYELVIRIAD